MKRIAAITVFAAMSVLALPAAAQTFGGAFDGMTNSRDPIQIEADRLEVVDGEGTALFSGNVLVTQGTTELKTERLRVLYGRDAGGKAGPGGAVKRIEASGRVAVSSGDQIATAEKASVDMDSQIASLSGNVSVSQGNNIITGCVVTIDMKTNNIKVQPCSQGSGSGRVKVLIDRAPGQ